MGRHLPALAALLLALSASSAGATTIPPVPDAGVAPEQRVAAGSGTVLTLRTADPERGQPPWTLRVSRSVTGLECSAVGQVEGAAFGLVGLDGAFRELPEVNADACARPGALIGTRVFAARRLRNVRTVVSGVAGPGLRRVTVEAGGRARTVPHSSEGAFVHVLRGYPEDAAPAVTLELSDGTRRKWAYASGKGFTVPDPYGGRAWKLRAFGFGTPQRTRKPPRVQTGCISFMAARAVPDEVNAGSPPVCGLQPGRPGMKLKPLYFTTRRLSGDGPGGGFLSGDWNRHPARVAVWGSAREAKRIVVRAPGLSRRTRPLLNGGFLVLLPARTDPARVTVQIDGRRFGRSHGTVRPPEQARAAAATATAARQPVPVDDTTERGRLPDGRYSPGMVHYRVHRPRIVARLADPAGGPGWALQVFDAERLTLQRPARTLARARVITRNRCVQLGRLEGNTFGWVYGDGRFRRTGIEDQLLQCTGRKRPRAEARMAGVLAIADPATPALTRSVLWGLAPAGEAVTVAGTGGADGAATVEGGAFLRLGEPSARPGAGAKVTVGQRTIELSPDGPLLPSRLRSRITFPTPIAGSERVEALAPDPAGGPHYAMLVAATQQGVPCVTGPGRVVEGRGGFVDLRLALFSERALGQGFCRPLQTAPSKQRPCDIGYGFSNEEDFDSRDAFTARARLERRLSAGRTTLYAQCGADVQRVTLHTPRDVRELVPSPVGHAVLGVYDGEFVDGEFVLTAQLRDGTTWTERGTLGGF